ncbi:MAG TPA: KOW motif-containing protein [Victivallales bacterium]|nr:KOW motif-containing protein [Victivallales bacterium]HPO89714.1 KOW motif-containing protein [Victivallales bacterium]HRU00824.1 KOW motif-containing protein [Victivallales bacterium]
MNKALKKNDIVYVLSGNFRGEKAKILAILKKKNRAVLEMIGLSPEKEAMIGTRTIKKSQKNPKGGRIERKVSTHISNLKLYEEKQGEK